MANTVNLTCDEIAMALAGAAKEMIAKQNENNKPIHVDSNYISPFAAYLLNKADVPIARKNGVLLSKSEIDETTLDFTQNRSLTEETNEATIKYIFDKSPYLSMFNSRVVDKLVTPIKGRSVTKKNLISNEQKGGEVNSVNRRIVHNFGINLYLKHINLQKDIPLQTVIDNLYNENFETETMDDVAIALANDILLLVTNGIEYDSYSTTENFYDLNKGFVKILMDADGKHTNTYGQIQVNGFNGVHLTSNKIDATDVTGVNYTPANLLALMRKMYQSLPLEYRNNPNNVWLMSQMDADLYMDSRSDMTSPSNVTREAVLTNGLYPNFMGHRIVVIPDMYGINEIHEYTNANVPGAIIFGDPKNIDVAISRRDWINSVDYNARGVYGATYEYDYHAYIDVQVMKPNSFVIAYRGAKPSDPIVVSESGHESGNSGEYPISNGVYTITGTDTDKFYVYCDNPGAVIVKSNTDITGLSYDTKEELDALVSGDANTEYIANGDYFTMQESGTVYLRAYHPNCSKASNGITCNVTIS